MRSQWNPFEEMNTLMRDMDRLFRQTLFQGSTLPTLTGSTQGRQLSGPSETTAFTPAVEVYRKDKNLVLRAELPGVKPEDVEISVVGNQLHVRGERKQNKEVNRDNYYFTESTYGRFERVFTLPEGIKPEDVKASFENGILEIQLPAEALDRKTHRVQIQGAPKKAEAGKEAGKSAA